MHGDVSNLHKLYLPFHSEPEETHKEAASPRTSLPFFHMVTFCYHCLHLTHFLHASPYESIDNAVTSAIIASTVPWMSSKLTPLITLQNFPYMFVPFFTLVSLQLCLSQHKLMTLRFFSVFDASVSSSSRSALRAPRTCWRGWSTPLTFMASALLAPQKPPPWSRRFPATWHPPQSLRPQLAAHDSTPTSPWPDLALRSPEAARGTRCTPSTRPSVWLLPHRRLAASR